MNISIIPDPVLKRIVIRDSGIGMGKKDLVSNLGTIARSGTQEFLNNLEKNGQEKTGENLIGQVSRSCHFQTCSISSRLDRDGIVSAAPFRPMN